MSPEIIQLPKFCDQRGNLSFVEIFNQIPFEIKRVYWIYDVPGGESRWGHGYKNNEEFIIALSGSCIDMGDRLGVVACDFDFNIEFVG